MAAGFGVLSVALLAAALLDAPGAAQTATRLPPPGIGPWPVRTAAPALSGFLHPTGTFFLRYPADWRMEATANGVDLDDPVRRAHVAVTFARLGMESGQVSLDDLVTAFVQETFGRRPDFELAQTWREPDGSLKAAVVYTSDEGETMAAIVYGEIHSRMVYYQSYAAAARWYDRYVDAFQVIAESFAYNAAAAVSGG